MSNKSSKAVGYNEERIDTIVGIITVLVVLALVAWLFVSISVKSNAISPVAYDGEARRGSEQVFTANVTSSKIKSGDKVQWIVNGEVVHEDTYSADSPVTLNYTPTTSGSNLMTVKIGKFAQSRYIDVLPPELTITAPNITVVYGERLPNFDYECSGFVGEDCADMMDYNGMCYLCDTNNEPITCDKLDVGVYKLNMEQSCCYSDYQVNYVGGTLTVLPKRLNVTGNFVKTYDQCNTIENPSITLVGVEGDDEVCAICDKLYFDNKNVGTNKTIMLANVELDGQDAHNYVLEETTNGCILPKSVEITGLTICDKMYDGTTRAQIDRMGALDGVCDGDSVAIGSLELSFAEANAGEQQIVLDNVSLVGADKDNYTVIGVDVETATINDTIWNKIFVKNPAITADNA